jgi:hypothetical protein
MLAAAAAALVVQVLAGAQPLAPAPLRDEPALPALPPPVLARLPVVVPLVLARLPAVAAHLAVEPGVPVELLPSRQSCSAAMAGSSPSLGPPTYEPVPRSR